MMVRVCALRLFLAISLSMCAITALSAPQLDADAAQREAAQFLRDLIRIDTQNPPGNETQVARYVQAVLERNGIESEILELLPGRGSIVARLKGDGSKQPILLLAHEDVVPVDKTRWTVDPLSGVEKDGIIWGRGAWDDKGSIAANLEVMLQLKRMKVPLRRDVIFLAEASEEAHSDASMNGLVQRYWDKIGCEFALNEDGESLIENGKIKYMGVGAMEKLPRRMRLVASGSTGHASIPLDDNAVVHLAAAVERVGNWSTPPRLNAVTEEFFKRLAGIANPNEAAWYRNVLDPMVQEELRTKRPRYYSMSRTSVVPTMLQAGIKSNVIPSTAEATLDIRMLPDENMPAFRDALATIIHDPAVRIVTESSFTELPPPPTGLDTELFRALERAQVEVAPEAITLPLMGTGATDSAVLRKRGVIAYGIDIPKTADEMAAKHGNDERIQVAQLGVFVRYLFRAVTLVAATQ